MSGNPIPSVLINAKIYNEGKELLGAGSVEFPTFEFMTESVTGMGLAGEIDIPVLGHFKSMTMSVTWNTVCEQAVELFAPRTHKLAIYGSIQKWDTGAGTFAPAPVKVLVQGTPKISGVGKLEPAKKMDAKTDFELTYVKMSIGGGEMVEIDKLNFICRIDGTDYLSGVRGHLGM